MHRQMQQPGMLHCCQPSVVRKANSAPVPCLCVCTHASYHHLSSLPPRAYDRPAYPSQPFQPGQLYIFVAAWLSMRRHYSQPLNAS